MICSEEWKDSSNALEELLHLLCWELTVERQRWKQGDPIGELQYSRWEMAVVLEQGDGGGGAGGVSCE